MNSKLGLTRNVIRRNYALLTPDGYVASVLPGWTGCVSHVIISAAMGAGLVQLMLNLDASGKGNVETEADEWFVYVVSGKGLLDKTAVKPGSYAYIPPGESFQFSSKAKGTVLLVFKKVYEQLPGSEAGSPPRLIAHEDDIASVDFLGDPHARLKTLLPDSLAADMAVNIFTYDPGATLPFVETHVMEHGMLFLEGGGVYKLDEDWHPVTKGDSIWIAPYCPQWFIASGPDPARYIYYKDINRNPA